MPIKFTPLVFLLCALGVHAGAGLAAEGPQIEFINQRAETVKVFWLPKSGEPKPMGEIAAGASKVLTTTIGHEFGFEGEAGFSEKVVALRDRQVVSLLTDEAKQRREKYEAVDGYTAQQVGAWLVLVSDELRGSQPAATARALELLEVQCRRVSDALVDAPEALQAVTKVVLWFSPQYEGFRMKAEYHPGAKWIEDNGRHPLLTKSVELTNIPILEKECVRMPMLLLHELAHAYHDQVVGGNNPKVLAAFREAVLKKSYEKVARHNGRPQKAYAITNPQEYFAETSEAYFGQNDFYPFDRHDLLQHDPNMFAVLASLWQGRETVTEPVQTSFEVSAPPVDSGLDPFYQKYTSASGLPIVAAAGVNDYALREAAYIGDLMLAERPDVRDEMIRSGSRLIVMGYDQFSTDIPEYAHMRPKDFWDARARGFGGSRTEEVCSCAEENVLAYPGDPYAAENILIHEFAHNIHLRGMVRVDATFDDRLKAAYDDAMAKGLWAGKYAATNRMEYFAEGVQSWFDDNRENDHDHNHVNTRAELIAYDPGLAAMCDEVFGDTKLAYTKPTGRLTGHMAGYDPSKAPTFVWPERLLKAKQEIRRKAQLRSDRAAAEAETAVEK